MHVAYVIILGFVVLNCTSAKIDLEQIQLDPKEYCPSIYNTNKHNYKIIDLNPSPWVYIPRPPQDVNNIYNDEELPFRSRKVVPSLKPYMADYAEIEPVEDEKRTYDDEKMRNLSLCCKLKAAIKEVNPKVIIYIAAPGERREDQSVRTFLQAMLKRRDHIVIFVDCNLPPLYDLKEKYDRESTLICVKNVSVCLSQLRYSYDKDRRTFHIHIVGLGLSAYLAVNAAMKSPMRIDRITALDPLNEKLIDMLNTNRLHNLFNRLHKLDSGYIIASELVVLHTNMYKHGLSKIIETRINIVINGGKRQVKCKDSPRISSYPESPNEFFLGFEDLCSHTFAFKFFVHNIQEDDGGLIAYKCQLEEDYNQVCVNVPDDSTLKVGFLERIYYIYDKKGTYQVMTGGAFPTNDSSEISNS